MSESPGAIDDRDCIVVTGASRGIGAAIALALAQQGRHVACLSRSGALPAGAGRVRRSVGRAGSACRPT